MDADLSLVAKGLARRLGEIVASMERYSAFAFQPSDNGTVASSRSPIGPGERRAAAGDLVLRMLSVLADPVNARLLDRVSLDDETLDVLGAHVGIPRVAVHERVLDLVQVGIVAHDLESDRVGLTASGQQLMAVIHELIDAVAEEVPET